MAHIDPFNPRYDTRRHEYEYMNRAYSGGSGIGAFLALLILLGAIAALMVFGTREAGQTRLNPTLTPPITQPAPATIPPRAPNG